MKEKPIFRNDSTGSLEGDAIVRRQFLKRSGGATAASVAAWNMTSKSLRAHDADEEPASLHCELLWCLSEPGKSDYENAWPKNFAAAKRNTSRIAHETTRNGQGVVWDLYHWVEIADTPKNKDNRELVDNAMTGTATAHMVVTRSEWIYERQGTVSRKVRWVTVVETHQTAEIKDAPYKVTTQGTKEDPTIHYVDQSAQSNDNGPHKITFGNKTIGWAIVSISVKDFKLRSDAVFVPKTEKLTESWDASGNISASFGGENVGGSVGASGGYSQTLGINAEPDTADIELEWTFSISESANSAELPVQWTPGTITPPTENFSTNSRPHYFWSR